MNPLLTVTDLTIDISQNGEDLRVVDDVSFELRASESLGLVGESGSGKTLSAMSLLRMTTAPSIKVSGEVLFEGIDLLRLTPAELRSVRGNRVSMVYQDALSALNPVRTIGHQIIEAIRAHSRTPYRKARETAIALLGRVGIPDPERAVRNYPHEFSGGMRQRAMIAMALACEPRLLIADEPTTALDVTVQAQVLETFDHLRRTSDMGLLFISHDLRAIARICDRVAVMYAGRIVEYGSTADVLRRPSHPYTQALLGALPQKTGARRRLKEIPGSPPAPGRMPSGCRFHPRCPLAKDVCVAKEPEMEWAIDRLSRCHFAKEVIASHEK